jgi:peptidoglycan hydrolase-like protein with peptidoglycan-binding domain
MTLHRGYEPASKCSSGPTSGAKAAMSWFLGAYGARGGYNLGIYNCRSVVGGSTLSLHGEGRATDFGVPPGGNAWGWTLARALVANSKELGIQCVIWDQHIWSGSYPEAGFREYGGENPHTDHLHVEYTRKAATTLTAKLIQLVLSGIGTPPAEGTTPTLRRGATGTAVRYLQERLAVHGIRVTVDGVFGPATETAVRGFQKLRRLTVDGIVGPKTWTALRALPYKPPTAKPRPLRPLLQRGSTHKAAVELVQQRLKTRYPAYAKHLKVDGIFGPATETAVREFQERSKIAVDGRVGPVTWARLGF